MNRLWLRLFVAFLTILLVAVGTAWLLAARSTSDQFTDFLEDEQAARIARVQQVFRSYRLQTGSWAGIQVLTQRVGELSGEHVVVVDADRVVVADSLSYYLEQTANPSWQGVQLPITDGATTLGTVYLSPTRPANLADLRQRSFVEARNRSLLAASLAGLAAAIALSVILARVIARPIESVTGAARQMQRGNLRPELTVEGHDPEEVQALGRAFTSLAQTLERAEQLRRNMVSDIAHELRTPLSNVRGYLEAIQDGMVQATPEVLEILERETLSLARLVEDLQELSQVEAGQLRLQAEYFPVQDLIGTAVQAVQAYPNAADREFSVEIVPEHLEAFADPVRAGQVLRNLLSNAIRYTRAGGQVRVSARPAPNGLVAISVRDNGVGIAPEDVPLIFERFYRTGAARDRASGGTGLGLTIARQLVRSHGGELSVRSQLGLGSTFTFTLPISQATAAPLTSAPPAPAVAEPPVTPYPALGVIAGASAGVMSAGVEAVLISLEGSRATFWEVLPPAIAINGLCFMAAGGLAGALFGALDRNGRGLPRPVLLGAIASLLAAPSLWATAVQVRRLPAVADFATSSIVPTWLPMVSLVTGLAGALAAVIVALLTLRWLRAHPEPARRPVAGLLGGLLAVAVIAGGLPFAQLQPPASQAATVTPADPDRPTVEPLEDRPNVLLVTFSSLRADHSSAYGYPRATTPALLQLAAAGVQFEHAYTPQPHVLTGHAAILTGLYPEHNGVTGFAGDRLSPRATTIAELLGRAGYETAAFYSSPAPGDPLQPLARGFQRVAAVRADTAARGGSASPLGNYRRFSHLLALPAQLNELLGIEDPSQRAYGRADSTTNAALDWLAQQSGRPFLLWVHYFDPHTPHAPPEPYATLFFDACVECDVDRTIDRLRSGGSLDATDRTYAISQYDGEIRFADGQLRRLLDRLEATGQRDRTLVIATSSNGLPLGELSHDSRSAWLLDAGIRVPLILSLPRALPKAISIAAPVQTVDVLPTVADLLGLPPVAADGQSLVPLIHGEPSARASLFAALPDHSRLAIISGAWKLIYGLGPEPMLLLNGSRGEGELADHSAEHPALVAELQHQLLTAFRRQD